MKRCGIYHSPLCVLVLVFFVHGIAVAAEPLPQRSVSTAEPVPVTEIRRFVSVFNAVRAAYVESVEDKALMQSAVRGLLLDLDPHSVYFDAEDARAFADSSEGNYEGIGVEVAVQDDHSLQVIAPIEGGPAETAGIRAGDVVISVDGKSMELLQGTEPLRGPAGTTVRLGIQRPGQKKKLTFAVERAAIHMSSVRSRMLEPGYGYLRISNFQADTGADFVRHATRLAESNGGLKGLLLDLRANPGGLLTAAVDVADSLLHSGSIVSTRGRLPASDTQFDATAGAILEDIRIVVMVDGASASAAEVLAAALRDNERARLFGSRTFGKGSVQNVLPLDNGDSVKLTTARYYTPSGRSIQGVGITPDHVVDVPSGERSADDALREADLAGHLLGDAEDSKSETSSPGLVLHGDEYIGQALDYMKLGFN